jgi:hypothetical protein
MPKRKFKPVNDIQVEVVEKLYQFGESGGLKDSVKIGLCDICGKRKKINLCSDDIYRCSKCIDLAFPEGFIPLA